VSSAGKNFMDVELRGEDGAVAVRRCRANVAAA